MADISKITLPSGTTYDIKDEVARQAIAGGISFIVSINASTTPKGVTWMQGQTLITGTLDAAESVVGAFYLVPSENAQVTNIYREYVAVGTEGEKYWEMLGDTQITGLNKNTTSVLKSITAEYPGDTAIISGNTTDEVLGSGTTFNNASSSVTINNTNHKTTASRVSTAGSAGTMTTIDTSKFSGGSLSAGSFNGGSGSFTQGTDTHTTTTYSVANETLSITAGSFTQGTDTHTHTAATHTQGTLTPAALETGFYTEGQAPTMPTFETVNDLWNGYDSASAAAQTITVGTNDKVNAVTNTGTVTVSSKSITITPTTETVLTDVSLTD